MSDHINDGGPAFPQVAEEYSHENDRWHVVTSDSGMTLRDYFAANASEEDIRAQAEVIRERFGILPDRWRQIARYMHADAMLKARASR